MKFVSTIVAAAALFELALAQISGEATCYFANGTALPKKPGYLAASWRKLGLVSALSWQLHLLRDKPLQHTERRPSQRLHQG